MADTFRGGTPSKKKMWRYIAGVKRSAEKTSQEEPVDKEAKVKKRFFKERWRKADNGESRDWLVYEETSLTMFCLVCRQHASEDAKPNSFIVVVFCVSIVSISLRLEIK